MKERKKEIRKGWKWKEIRTCSSWAIVSLNLHSFSCHFKCSFSNFWLRCKHWWDKSSLSFINSCSNAFKRSRCFFSSDLDMGIRERRKKYGHWSFEMSNSDLERFCSWTDINFSWVDFSYWRWWSSTSWTNKSVLKFASATDRLSFTLSSDIWSKCTLQFQV